MLLSTGRLLQQYIMDMYIKLETSRLDYLRNKQGEIRAELYQGIVDIFMLAKRKETKLDDALLYQHRSLADL